MSVLKGKLKDALRIDDQDAESYLRLLDESQSGKLKFEKVMPDGSRRGVLVSRGPKVEKHKFYDKQSGEIRTGSTVFEVRVSADGLRYYVKGLHVLTIRDLSGTIRIVEDRARKNDNKPQQQDSTQQQDISVSVVLPSLPQCVFDIKPSRFGVKLYGEVIESFSSKASFQLEAQKAVITDVRFGLDGAIYFELKGSGTLKIPPLSVVKKQARRESILKWNVESHEIIDNVIKINVSASVSAAAGDIIDPSASFVPPIAIYDGHVERANDQIFGPPYNNAQSSAYFYDQYPAVSRDIYMAGDKVFVASQISLGFDTSGIPDNAYNLSATLVLWVWGRDNRDNSGFTLSIDWATGELNFNQYDWKYPFSNSAFGPIQSDYVPEFGTWSIELNNVDSTVINLTGITALRIFAKANAFPTGERCSFEIATREHETQSYWPTLVVTYSVPAIEGSAALASSAESQAVGVIQKLGAGTLQADSVLGVSGMVLFYGGASLTADATMEASCVRVATGSAALSADATLTAEAAKWHIGDATLKSYAELSGDCFLIMNGQAALVAEAVDGFAANIVAAGSASLTAESILSAQGVIAELAAAQLEASAECSVQAATLVSYGGAAINARAHLTCIGVTAFGLRTLSRVLQKPLLPRYPSSSEELVQWATAITRAVDIGFKQNVQALMDISVISGRLSEMPDPTGSLRLYWAVDADGGNGRMYIDDGAWRPL